MTDEPQQCDAYSEDLAELALGILTGRARAATLAHVDSCAHCAEELEQLSRAADAVVSVAPELEPTVGFEVRLFNRMGLSDDPAPAPRPGPRPPWGLLRRMADAPRWALASAAAVVALLVGLSIGWSIGSPSGSPHPTEAATAVATAVLKEHGDTVGTVATYGGATPWMIMTLDDSSAPGQAHVRGRHRRRRDAPDRHLLGQLRLRRLGRPPQGGAPGRAQSRSRVVERDGDRHRLVALRTSTGTSRACTAHRPALRCSQPGPG